MSYQARHMRGSEAKTEEAPAAQQVVPAEAKTACDQAVADLKAGKVDLKALFD